MTLLVSSGSALIWNFAARADNALTHLVRYWWTSCNSLTVLERDADAESYALLTGRSLHRTW